jgi:hypothetical protein
MGTITHTFVSVRGCDPVMFPSAAYATEKFAGQITRDLQRYQLSALSTWPSYIGFLQSFSPISGLFRFGYPSAIFRRVRSVIVNTLNCQIVPIAIGQGPFAKGDEIGHPLDTDDDPASAIVVKPFFVRICAAILDPAPNCIEAGIASAVASVCYPFGHREPPAKVRCQVTGRCFQHWPVAHYIRGTI